VAGPGDRPARTFDITNRGTRTIFVEREETADIVAQHRQFEQFQKSLITYYGHYKRTVPALNRGAADSAPPVTLTKAGEAESLP